MKYKNIFKKVKKSGPIEYSETILKAVLDPKIKGLILNFNGGYDWIDQKYKFIFLLLSRGQIRSISSGSDLLAHDEYLKAVINSQATISITLEARKSLKPSAYASEKRIMLAREKMSLEFSKARRSAA